MKLPLILFSMFLLVLPMAFAGNESHVNNTFYYNASLIWNADNSLVEDNSSFAIVGVANGDPTLVTNDMACGRASVAFDGTGDYIGFDGTSIAGSMDNQENFSVEFWLKTTTSNTDYQITRIGASSTTPYWRVSMNSGGQLGFLVAGTTNDWSAACFVGAGTNDGTWHHLVYIFNRTAPTKTSGQIYLDGTIVGTSGSCITDFNIGTTAGFRGTNLTIGAGEAGVQPTTANIDGVIIHNRSLTSDDVAVRYNNSDCTLLTNETLPPPPPAGDPPAINATVNITSECVTATCLGQLVNISDPLCTGTGCIIPRTNDTTLTLITYTNKSATVALVDHGREFNYTDMIAYNGASECSTTGGIKHEGCTLTNDNETDRTGVHLFCLGAKDGDGNENLSCTFGPFAVNITDPFGPNSTLYTPRDVALFLDNIHNHNITLTINGEDNVDRNFTLEVYINGSLEITNSTYLNGTNVSYIFERPIGIYNWSTRMIDSYNNINTSVTLNFEVRGIKSFNVSYGEKSTTRLKFKVRNLGSKNVTPINQSVDIPAFNVTNNGTYRTDGGLWIRLNESLPTGYLFSVNTSSTGICKGGPVNTTAKNIYTPPIGVNETIPIYVCMNLSFPVESLSVLQFLFNVT